MYHMGSGKVVTSESAVYYLKVYLDILRAQFVEIISQYQALFDTGMVTSPVSPPFLMNNTSDSIVYHVLFVE